jgi:hypothetical protein
VPLEVREWRLTWTLCEEWWANARRMFVENTKALTLEQALFAAGGYRSVLGVVKHIGGWAHVYRSYAFDERPRHWAQTAWPRGRIDTVDATQEYFDEVVAWTEAGLKAWDEALARVEAGTLDQPRPMHWGGRCRSRRSRCSWRTTSFTTPAN